LNLKSILSEQTNLAVTRGDFDHAFELLHREIQSLESHMQINSEKHERSFSSLEQLLSHLQQTQQDMEIDEIDWLDGLLGGNRLVPSIFETSNSTAPIEAFSSFFTTSSANGGSVNIGPNQLSLPLMNDLIDLLYADETHGKFNNGSINRGTARSRGTERSSIKDEEDVMPSIKTTGRRAPLSTDISLGTHPSLHSHRAISNPDSSARTDAATQRGNTYRSSSGCHIGHRNAATHHLFNSLRDNCTLDETTKMYLTTASIQDILKTTDHQLKGKTIKFINHVKRCKKIIKDEALLKNTQWYMEHIKKRQPISKKVDQAVELFLDKTLQNLQV
jgi:hypothetical protein